MCDLDKLSSVRVTLGDARAEGRFHPRTSGPQGACPEAAPPAGTPGQPGGPRAPSHLRGLAAAC